MRRALLPLLALVLPAPALAQAADPHAGHDMADMAPPNDTAVPEDTPVGTDQPPGSAEAPPVSHERAADRYFDPAAMAQAEATMMRPPITRYATLVFDLAELQVRDGHDGYRWESEAWVGDLNRFVVKSEGEGTFGRSVEHAELQALYAHALDPWWTAQVGLRQDFGAGPQRTWASLGIDGRAPYQFDVEGTAFLSDKGQLTARIEVAYDQRITQRLVLQPRAEINVSAQDMPAERIGAGLSTAELGLRLRYEIRRAFAPYIGVNWSRSMGRTGGYARANGDDAAQTSLVMGVRTWF